MNKFITTIIFIIITVSSYILIFQFQFPYRLYNSDIFHQLSIMKEFKKNNLITMQDSFYSLGPVDLHAGPYYLFIHLITLILEIEAYDAILLAAFFNILFLLSSLYFFAKSFNLNKLQTNTILILSYTGWGTFTFFFAGIYEYTNLLINGSFPSTLGIGYIFIIIGLIERYYKSKQNKLVLLITLLTAVLIVSHLLSGVILLSFVGLLTVLEVFKNKKITKEVVVLSGSLITSIIISLFIWPLFNLVSLIFSTKTVEVGSTDRVKENFFEVSDWPYLVGLLMLGFSFLPLLIKRNLHYFALLLCFCSFMTASYLLPIRVSLFWRYFPFIFFSLTLSLAIGISTLNKKLAIIVISGLLVYGIINTSDRIALVFAGEIFKKDSFNHIKIHIPDNAVLLADPNTAYHFAALYPVRVVSVSYNHANPALIAESKQRYDETMIFLTSNLDKTAQDQFLKKYNVEYILINREYYPDYITLLPKMDWPEKFELKVDHEKVLEDTTLTLFKVTKNNKNI